MLQKVINFEIGILGFMLWSDYNKVFIYVSSIEVFYGKLGNKGNNFIFWELNQ